MFVRYVGVKVCYTLPDGRFYITDREEATQAELEVCESGGGDMPLSDVINSLAH